VNLNLPGTATLALERAAGVAQHHDAVAGTSKQRKLAPCHHHRQVQF
jgi:hypothetical protein